MRIKNEIVNGHPNEPKNTSADKCRDGCVQHLEILSNTVTKRRGEILEEPLDSFSRHNEILHPDPSLTVPNGVVLTDAHVTFSLGENFPNSASLFIHDFANGKTYVYEIVNNTTFHAGVDLGSGILSTGQLTVELSCNNISGNQCQGALMWSGYKP